MTIRLLKIVGLLVSALIIIWMGMAVLVPTVSDDDATTTTADN